MLQHVDDAFIHAHIVRKEIFNDHFKRIDDKFILWLLNEKGALKNSFGNPLDESDFTEQSFIHAKFTQTCKLIALACIRYIVSNLFECLNAKFKILSVPF